MSDFSVNLKLGQIAFCVEATGGRGCDFKVSRHTVGQVRVQRTLPSARICDSYAIYEEVYMCIETGVGSGTLWEYGKNIFATEAEAQAGVVAHEQRAHKRKAEKEAAMAEAMAAQERRDREELARLQAKYLEKTGGAA